MACVNDTHVEHHGVWQVEDAEPTLMLSKMIRSSLVTGFADVADGLAYARVSAGSTCLRGLELDSERPLK